jgi:hypothetical protein
MKLLGHKELMKLLGHKEFAWRAHKCATRKHWNRCTCFLVLSHQQLQKDSHDFACMEKIVKPPVGITEAAT